jgi:hypothetical protein
MSNLVLLCSFWITARIVLCFFAISLRWFLINNFVSGFIQVKNLSSVFKELDIQCKDFTLFKKYNPPDYPRQTTLLVSLDHFRTSILVPVIFPAVILYLTIFCNSGFSRFDCGFFVMLYMDHWTGKIMKDFSHVSFHFQVIFF